MFVRTPDALWTEFDGQVVVMSVSSGKYFEVKGVGADIWKLLEERRAAADIVRHLVGRYRVEAESCEQDVLTFLRSMLDAGLITEDNGNDSRSSLSA